jgi:hypothetical protein
VTSPLFAPVHRLRLATTAAHKQSLLLMSIAGDGLLEHLRIAYKTP